MADYLTVTALTKYLKRKFTADPYLQQVYLTGEVSNFRRRPRHQYFSLKDDNAVINVTLFQGVFNQLPFELTDGMQVNIIGHLDLYAPSGNYSILVDKIMPDGVGALALQFEQLKNKLQTEGVFNQLQRPIPKFPQKIAVVTSPSGAVIRDIMTTVQRRYPIAQIFLYPAVVQGKGAVPSIIKQLQKVAIQDYDVLIIGRGGGSIEDLWAFNDEQLARELIKMPMPIISSVGHETDTTITDFVADQRAATPTAAAELATPMQLIDVWQTNVDLQGRLTTLMAHRLQQMDERLKRVQSSVVLTSPARLYEGVSQRLDIAKHQLEQNFQQILSLKQHQLALTNQRLIPSATQKLVQNRQKFGQLVNALNLVSPLAVLARGYSVVTQDEQVVRTVDALEIDTQIKIRVADGDVSAVVTEKRKNNEQ
ncbi:exodeoxyribonuclease VII large subunit [Weissella diestrammenae]|uniref:Exodeoxyribonuclease 7 large subunit n=1 Tax=Weissella diestrammenae TaxID=1162633 RepID=A0A7G9T4B3_9LACO|nr:exodeoxyribonuclease VII large subunit [Weissella diestrammenae]QNN74938.1 exodeoxyribonuclease VII large subunit [Weissella diestrammenae]